MMRSAVSPAPSGAVSATSSAPAARRQTAPAELTGALGAERCAVPVLHPEAIAQAQAGMRGEADYADLAETFRALGDPSRAKILHALATVELCVCDLAALVGISESAVSQHLRVLRSLRLVRNRKVGRVVYYTLEDACIRALLAVALGHLDDPVAARASGTLTTPRATPLARDGDRGRRGARAPQEGRA
ncbi:MAG TPA: metalloregulator ArsR/SmtB family transcription factor [Chloroflexota bacterium]|jgi:DNA-binding transcriptional ArsR family regulator|nr:metalloregulator ArsR/SmtB family transcription factor [Chloroflexota bacterium]